MSLSLLNSTILRQKIASGFITKGSSIAWLEEDDNWTIVVDAIRELANVPTDTTGFEEYNAGTTYEDGDFVAYNGNIYQYINNVPSAGVTPGTDPLYWEIASQGQFAHERNKDQYLDFEGTHQVSAEDLFNLLNVGPGNYLHQGTNIQTEDLNIYTDDNDLLIQSGEEGGTDPRSQFGLSASAASLSYLNGDVVNSVNVDNLSVNLSHADAGTPSNDSAIGCVDGKVSVVGDIEITDVTKGIIMTDQDGSGNRYRITILGASFNLELLP